MIDLELDGGTLIFITLLFNIILVFGLYLAINFFRKMITLGRAQSQYVELILGVIFTALGLFLKFGLIA